MLPLSAVLVVLCCFIDPVFQATAFPNSSPQNYPIGETISLQILIYLGPYSGLTGIWLHFFTC